MEMTYNFGRLASPTPEFYNVLRLCELYKAMDTSGVYQKVKRAHMSTDDSE